MNKNLFTYQIFNSENQKVAEFNNQKNDFCVFKYILNHSSQSVDWNLKNKNFVVLIVNEVTSEITNYYDSTGNN